MSNNWFNIDATTIEYTPNNNWRVLFNQGRKENGFYVAQKKFGVFWAETENYHENAQDAIREAEALIARQAELEAQGQAYLEAKKASK